MCFSAVSLSILLTETPPSKKISKTFADNLIIDRLKLHVDKEPTLS